MAPLEREGGGLATRLGPEAPQVWAGTVSEWSALLKLVHGVVVFFNGGVGWGALSIVAGHFQLLLHLGRVGWWRALRRQLDGAILWALEGDSMGWRQGIALCAVRVPQSFLGSFALQGASSSVLKPHLDRKEKIK